MPVVGNIVIPRVRNVHEMHEGALPRALRDTRNGMRSVSFLVLSLIAAALIAAVTFPLTENTEIELFYRPWSRVRA